VLSEESERGNSTTDIDSVIALALKIELFVFFGRLSCETWSQAGSLFVGQRSSEGCQLDVSDLLFTRLTWRCGKLGSSEMLPTTQRLLIIQDYIK
jgi:hypothetical protein